MLNVYDKIRGLKWKRHLYSMFNIKIKMNSSYSLVLQLWRSKQRKRQSFRWVCTTQSRFGCHVKNCMNKKCLLYLKWSMTFPDVLKCFSLLYRQSKGGNRVQGNICFQVFALDLLLDKGRYICMDVNFIQLYVFLLLSFYCYIGIYFLF